MAYRKYKDDDYKGELNILRHEKILIMRAFLKCKGDSVKMAVVLEIAKDDLLRKVRAHRLESSFLSWDAKSLIISELEILEKE